MQLQPELFNFAPVFSAFNIYREIPHHILMVVLAEFCLQLVNSSFFLLLNYYMVDEGYTDPVIADAVSWRFGAVMLFAAPLGLFIKGRKVKPFFYAATLLAPIVSLYTVWAIGTHQDILVKTGLAMWGATFMCLHVTVMPYILLNTEQKHHSNSIALFFQTWGVAMIVVGGINFILNKLFPGVFDHKTLLYMYAVLSSLGVFFIMAIKVKEQPSNKVSPLKFMSEYDWPIIIRVLIPTLIIAIGAGFTIPFINLFFLKVHGVQEDTFSLLGAFSYGLVALGVLYIPIINRRFGYGVSITLIQVLAVIALIILATTELYAGLSFAVYIAIGAFVVRQPLMNLAGPMTSELTMYYVGPRNRELISALNASIWSGSWWISSRIFSFFRTQELPYYIIFLITATLYIFGIMWYAYLIRDYKRRKAAGLIDL